MHSTTLFYLTILGGLGASGKFVSSSCLVQIIYYLTGSPLAFDKRQLIAFPANFPFQSLSGDQAGALSAIQSNNLKG